MAKLGISFFTIYGMKVMFRQFVNNPGEGLFIDIS